MDEKNRPVDASGFEETEYEAQHFELDAEWQHASSSKAERALVRKLDWRLVPACWLMYLLSNIDRSNIGYGL